jgi:inward rectifier potassium channel
VQHEPEHHHLHLRHRLRGDRTMRIQMGAFELSKKGVKRYDWRDPYHVVMGLTWSQFALFFVMANLSLNLLFAILLSLQPGAVANARPGRFTDLFFFSMETLATVGYGVFSPATLYAHIVASTEIITGVAFTALMTGITFVRFARPRAKVLFADNAVIANYNGKPTLMVRIANGRVTMLTDARAHITVLIGEFTAEGQHYRRVHDLPLARSHFASFALTWTLMHTIDEQSPIYGRDARNFRENDIRVFVSIAAYDLTLAAEVRAMQSYRSTNVLWGMRYVDAVSIDEQGRTIADLRRLSDIEPDAGTHLSQLTIAPEAADEDEAAEAAR